MVAARSLILPTVLVLVFAALVSIAIKVELGPGNEACDQSALICPDGSAVGRSGPDCRFAPCPTCECPSGYVLEGDVCNPGCYYSTPPCLSPSFRCVPGNITIYCSYEYCSPKQVPFGAGALARGCFRDRNDCASYDTACEADSDCVGSECCHPTSCINKMYKGVCNLLCTQDCVGPLDCGAGRCGCVDNKCAVIPG